MDDPLTLFPVEPQDEASRSPQANPPAHSAQRWFRRRLMALLAAGGTAFVLTTWFLVRLDDPLGPFSSRSGPAGVVKAHLEALNRGELRQAYEFFSRHFRAEVPFEAYHELVVTHRGMFRTHEFRFSRTEESGERAVLETDLLAEGGQRYRARFTLIRAEGHWWIDDLRWAAEPVRGQQIAI